MTQCFVEQGLPAAETAASSIVEKGAATAISVAVITHGEVRRRFHVVAPGQALQEQFYWTCAGKTLSVLATAALVDEGRLRFDDPIGAHLPGFDVGDWRPYRIADLLSYDVPVLDDPGVVSIYRDDPVVLEHVLRCGFDHGRDSPRPGRHRYYNIWTNAFLLSQIVSSVAMVPAEEYVGATVLQPLGLPSTTLRAPEHLITHHFAPLLGYFDADRRRAGVTEDAVIRADHFWPGVSVNGPICDLAEILGALLWAGDSPWSRCLVSSEVASRIARPVASGTAAPTGLTWGLGMIVDRRLAGRRGSASCFGEIGDNGSVAVVADPDQDTVIALGLRGCVAGPRVGLVRATVIDAVQKELAEERPTP